jgi:hypothetical protein
MVTGYPDIPKHLLRSARFKYLCEISDLFPDNKQYQIALDRIDEMYEMHEESRPE